MGATLVGLLLARIERRAMQELETAMRAIGRVTGIYDSVTPPD